MILEKIAQISKEIETFTAKDATAIETFKIAFLGRKGSLKNLMNDFKALAPEEKKKYGQTINQLRQKATDKLTALTAQFSHQNQNSEATLGDVTKQAITAKIGARHPINLVRNRIVNIFKKIGFGISEGPEIEDDWHNFTALNLPDYHPARDMQDTFFVEGTQHLLRTHTSSVQIRHMEKTPPPIRTLSPGRVFRNEDISARSNCFFHQIEGLYIDKNISFVDLKKMLAYFTNELFGTSKIRLRPSYFPFTEPSAEVDVYWGLKTETDYRITKGTGWLEIMGCGMVDPNVLKNTNIDPEKYSGFAFGMGIERIAMLLYQIPDIRMFFENDERFLAQFKAVI